MSISRDARRRHHLVIVAVSVGAGLLPAATLHAAGGDSRLRQLTAGAVPAEDRRLARTSAGE